MGYIINHFWIDGQKFVYLQHNTRISMLKYRKAFKHFIMFVCWFGNLIPCIKLKVIAIKKKEDNNDNNMHHKSIDVPGDRYWERDVKKWITTCYSNWFETLSPLRDIHFSMTPMYHVHNWHYKPPDWHSVILL